MEIDTQQGWRFAELLIQALVAVGTLGLALIALWGDRLRSLLASPTLRLRLRSSEGELTRLTPNQPARYYHVTVSNTRKWARAEDVAVYITAVERRGPDGNWQPRFSTGPLPLVWQFEHLQPRPLPIIGPERHCDLGRIIEGQPFHFTTRYAPNNFDSALVPGEPLRVTVVAEARDAESPPITLHLAWDGTWVEGAKEMAQHFVISQL